MTLTVSDPCVTAAALSLTSRPITIVPDRGSITMRAGKSALTSRFPISVINRAVDTPAGREITTERMSMPLAI